MIVCKCPAWSCDVFACIIVHGSRFRPQCQRPDLAFSVLVIPGAQTPSPKVLNTTVPSSTGKCSTEQLSGCIGWARYLCGSFKRIRMRHACASELQRSCGIVQLCSSCSGLWCTKMYTAEKWHIDAIMVAAWNSSW